MQKTVLITGANHGLGLSLVKVFLIHNYKVFAGVYKLSEGPQVQDEQSIHDILDTENLYIVEMDVSDSVSVEKAAEKVGEVTQSLDIVINNAGILCADSLNDKNISILEKLDVDGMMNVYNVNALGAVRVANAFTPLLLKSEEKLLINISSEAGSIADCGACDWHGYRMSKAAMNMAGAVIQNEYVKHGGRVWQLHPGWMQTYMHGKKCEQATYSSYFSAEHIYKLIQNADSQKSDELIFMDILGTPLPW